MQRQKLPEIPSRISRSDGVGLSLSSDHGRHDHSRRAVAALKPVLLPERILQRMQLPVGREALDRGDVGPVRLDGEDGARLHAPAVNQDIAGAALTRIAADVRAGQTELLARIVHEEHAPNRRCPCGPCR